MDSKPLHYTQWTTKNHIESRFLASHKNRTHGRGNFSINLPFDHMDVWILTEVIPRRVLIKLAEHNRIMLERLEIIVERLRTRYLK